MITIKLVPYCSNKPLIKCEDVVIADTAEEALQQLVAGINADTIDTENNQLIII